MRKFMLLAAALTTLSAAALADTPYQPSSRSHQYGYSDIQLDYNRLRVSFAGDSRTDRETVEANLMYRAAETTLQRGFDYFVVVDHDVATRTDYDRMGPPVPRARFRAIERFEATSEILMFRGRAPAYAANAFDARAVQSHLAMRIRYPR